MDRDPCPVRIWGDLGGAFAMGSIGGGLWHFGKGWRSSPKGFKKIGAYSAMRKRAPVLGGNFAIWGGIFSTFDCIFAYGRGKEDISNAIIAGAATGAVLSARAGIKASSRSAMVGGVLLVFIEGAAHVLQVYSERQQHEQLLQAQQAQQAQQGSPIPPPSNTNTETLNETSKELKV